MKQSFRTATGLLATGIDPLIEALDFSRIKNKLMTSTEEEVWTFEQCEIAEREYKRFLTLIKWNNGVSIVPTKQMDKFWHQHILDTAAYAVDCQQVFGYFLHHYPYFGINGIEDKKNLEASFKKTKLLYYQAFGEELDREEAARCKDHSCHTESNCACRVPGACKNH